jgi:hypothetical protein
MIFSTKFTFYIIFNKTISNKEDEGKLATESINKANHVERWRIKQDATRIDYASERRQRVKPAGGVEM